MLHCDIHTCSNNGIILDTLVAVTKQRDFLWHIHFINRFEKLTGNHTKFTNYNNSGVYDFEYLATLH